MNTNMQKTMSTNMQKISNIEELFQILQKHFAMPQRTIRITEDKIALLIETNTMDGDMPVTNLTFNPKDYLPAVLDCSSLFSCGSQSNVLTEREALKDCDKTLDFFQQIGNKEKKRWAGTDFDGPWNAVLGCCREAREKIAAALGKGKP